jgi:hypothetical protein
VGVCVVCLASWPAAWCGQQDGAGCEQP